MPNMQTEASVYIRSGVTFSVRNSVLSAVLPIFRSTQHCLRGRSLRVSLFF